MLATIAPYSALNCSGRDGLSRLPRVVIGAVGASRLSNPKLQSNTLKKTKTYWEGNL
jgi:hypothetical protein